MGGYQYTQYVGTIAKEACAGTAPAAVVSLLNQQTVCCR
jgi:hypothetical protein